MRIQNTSLIGLFLQEMGRLWRVSDCEELVGGTHRRWVGSINLFRNHQKELDPIIT